MNHHDELFRPDEIDEQIELLTGNGPMRSSDSRFLQEMQQVARFMCEEQNPMLQRTWERLQTRAAARAHLDGSSPYPRPHAEGNHIMHAPGQQFRQSNHAPTQGPSWPQQGYQPPQGHQSPQAPHSAKRRRPLLAGGLSTLVVALVIASVVAFLSIARGGGSTISGTSPGKPNGIQHPPVEIGSNTATPSCSMIDTQTNVNINSNGAAFRDSLAASWSSQGKIALSHWLVSIYNGSTCKHVSTLPANYTANVLSWSPDGSKLLANNFVLDATNGKQLAVFISPSVSQSTKTSEVTPLVDLSGSLVVVAAAWSPDGSRIVMAQNRTGSLAVSMYVWDAETGKALVTLNQAQAPNFQLANSLVWSPDGSTISAASGTSVYAWNSQTGALKHTYKHVADNWSAAISPDGKYVAAGINQLQAQGLSTDPALKIYELATGKVVATYTTQEADTLTSMAWSSDSQQLAVGNARGVVLVWNASTNTLSNPYTNGEEDVARSIAWSPNNRQFVIVHDGWDPSQISLDVWTFAAH
jgi:WD40 repeat protein